MELIRQHVKLGIALLRDEAEVAGGYRFIVVADGEIFFTSAVEAAAIAEYEDLHAQRRRPFVARQERDRAAGEARAMHAQTVARTYLRSSRKGGRGGRGGV
jgi:hypothetical protein